MKTQGLFSIFMVLLILVATSSGILYRRGDAPSVKGLVLTGLFYRNMQEEGRSSARQHTVDSRSKLLIRK